jgi:predicted dehydrogenase
MGVIAPPCRVAIVGAGNMAEQHARAFADVPGVRLVGIQSRTRPRAEALAQANGIEAVYDDVPTLYEQTRAELVVVTVPELAARSVVEICTAWPWTILMEKPPGYDLNDARQIQASARERGRHVFVALNRRFHSSTAAVTAALIGSDARRFIHVVDQEDLEAATASGQPELVVRNWMFANSIHVIDYLRVFGRGDVVSVTPVVAWNADAPWVTVAAVTFSSGDVGLYEGMWNGPGPWAVHVATNAERWELRPLESAAVQRRGERVLHPVERHAWDSAFKPGLRLMAEEAVKAALGQPHRLPTLADAIETMALVAAIFTDGAPDGSRP